MSRGGPWVTCGSHGTLLNAPHVARQKLVAEVRKQHVQKHLKRRDVSDGFPVGCGAWLRLDTAVLSQLRRRMCRHRTNGRNHDRGWLRLPEELMALGTLTAG